MDIQRQCVVKIKIYYKLVIYFFHTKIETLLYKYIIRIYKINFS